jgi:SulP family sulfate permease
MAVLAPIMAQIPLSALAGVLIVTAWRMNEWENIRYIFSRRFKTAIFTFLVTLAATVSLDLTQAILIGVFLSGLVYLNQSAAIHIQFKPVDPDKILERGIHLAQSELEKVTVAYLSGPLFFAATGHFTEAFSKIPIDATLILSMRGVPLVDTSGLQALQELQQKLNNGGGKLMITSLQPAVEKMLLRSGLADAVGEQNIFWSAELAIQAAAQSSIQAI